MVEPRSDAQAPLGAGVPNRINRLLLGKAKEEFKGLTNMVMLGNKGLNSVETQEVRSGLRSKGITMEVVRNRITRRALEEMGVEEADRLFDGPTAIVEGDDPVITAKVALDFCKKFEKKLMVLGGLVEGKVLGPKEILALSKSKSKPELLAELAGLIRGPGGAVAAALLGAGGRVAGAVKAHVEKLEKAEKSEGAVPAAAAG